MKQKILVVVIIAMCMAMVSCSSDKSSETAARYANDYFAYDNYVYFADLTAYQSGITFYNLKTDTTHSLCTDPLCSHSDSDCFLWFKQCYNLIAYDGFVYYLSFDMDSNEAGFYEYNIEKHSVREIYKYPSDSFYQTWCIWDSYLYFLDYENQDVRHIYRIRLSGGKAELVSDKNSGIISDFKVENNMLFYVSDNILYRDGEFLIELPMFMSWWDIYDGMLYFSDNYYLPEIEGNPETHALSLRACDIYRIDAGGDVANRELVLENTYGFPMFSDDVMYYSHCDTALAFKYLMPPDMEEMNYIYDFRNGTLEKLDLKSNKSTVLFAEKNIMIYRIVSVYDDMLIAEAVPYDGVSPEADSYALADNTGYYKITRSGDIIERISLSQ